MPSRMNPIILTDLAPAKVGPSWYALRFWIELGFKAIKSLGWKWDKTRRTDPARVSRHWLVLSVARCWPWPMAPGWKTPRTGGSPQAICAHRPKPAPYWIRGQLPIIGTREAVRRAPSASFATASTGSGACCSKVASGAASGCCHPGPNPSPTWKHLTYPCQLPSRERRFLVKPKGPACVAADFDTGRPVPIPSPTEYIADGVRPAISGDAARGRPTCQYTNTVASPVTW